jgi:hypothetical protein
MKVNVYILHATLLAILISATGCIKAEPVLTIKQDGSGSLDLDYSISEQATRQFKAMFKLQEELAAARDETAIINKNSTSFLFIEPDQERIEKKLAEYKELGITVEYLKVDTSGTSRTVKLKVSFKDVAALSKTDLFPTFGFTLAKTPNGTYIMRHANPNASKVKKPDLSKPDTVRELSSMLAGLSVTIRLNTPGRILKTNGQQSTATSVTWGFDFNRNPSALIDLQTKVLAVEFAGENVNLPQIKNEKL